MTGMMRNLRDRLDGWLLRRGYDHPEVRELVRNQLVLTGLIVVVCLPLSAVWAGAWSLAAGTGIVTANFTSLARFGQRITGFGKREAVAAVLVRFYVRLALTGAALFVCIAWLGARPIPLLAGIVTVGANFLIWGALRHAGSRTHQTLTGKEA